MRTRSPFLRSWKSTLAAVAFMFAAILTGVSYAFDDDPDTVADLPGIVRAVSDCIMFLAVSYGFIVTKDADKTGR